MIIRVFFLALALAGVALLRPALADDDPSHAVAQSISAMRALKPPGPLTITEHIEARDIHAVCSPGSDGGRYFFDNGGRTSADVTLAIDASGSASASLGESTCSGVGMFTPAAGYPPQGGHASTSFSSDDMLARLLATDPNRRFALVGHDTIDGAPVTRYRFLGKCGDANKDDSTQEDPPLCDVAIDDATGLVRYARFAESGSAGILGGGSGEEDVTFRPLGNAWIVSAYHLAIRVRITIFSRRWTLDITNTALPPRRQAADAR
jgi:hypothetical protein